MAIDTAGDEIQMEVRPGAKVTEVTVHDGVDDRHTANAPTEGILQQQQSSAGIVYPPRAYIRHASHSQHLALPTSATPNGKGPPATKFAPLPDSSRRQFARDSAVSLHEGDEQRLQEKKKYGLYAAGGKPSSTDSLPLQRVTSHGRASVLEMDLADEPMSAYEQAAPSMHEQAKRRRQGHHIRRRRHTPSIASKQTKRTVRSRAGKAIERIRRRRNSSSSSSSSSSSGSSSSSSSSGIDWRFWRSSTASSATDDSYIPPEPTFTLYTPRIKSSLLEGAIPSEQDLANLAKHPNDIPHPYTSKSSEQRDKQPRSAGATIPLISTTLPQSSEVFDVLHSRTLNPCLDRLKEFWLERDQTEGLGGDIGAAHLNAQDVTNPRMPRRNSSKVPSRAQSRSHSPDPSHPATSRRTRGTGAAWWLDVQCASTADMRQLRRVSLLS